MTQGRKRGGGATDQDHGRRLPSQAQIRREMDAERHRGFIYWRDLEDGRAIGVMPLLFGRATLGIGRADADEFDDVWDYPNVPRAIAVAIEWDPRHEKEPDGWIRHPRTRRYRPDGDPSRSRRYPPDGDPFRPTKETEE